MWPEWSCKNQVLNSQLTQGNLQVDLKVEGFEESILKFKSISIQFLKKVFWSSVVAYLIIAESVDFWCYIFHAGYLWK